ncbi:MAG: BON domain-containing protein [Janthinobacterium lividum]
MIKQHTNAQRNHALKRSLAAVVLCLATATTLQGCIGLAVGGAVVGTLAATDRRTLASQAADKEIGIKGDLRVKNMVGDRGSVSINSFNRKVLLTGEVRDEAMKANVEREVAALEGVESVVNELAVMPVASFSQRNNDTFVTGKVKASFVDARDVSSNVLKVNTERGVVYLMGRVTQFEGNRAAEIARGVPGVLQVVKVFEYISEDEARQAASQPQESTPQ